MLLSQPVYDKMKWFVQILLPAFGSFYFGLSDVLELPAALQVVGVCSLLAVFLGTILGISSNQYKKVNEPEAGFLQQVGVDPDTGNPDLALTLTKTPQELLNNRTITLKVDNPPVAGLDDEGDFQVPPPVQ